MDQRIVNQEAEMLTDARRAKAFTRDLRDEIRERLKAQPIPGVRLLRSTTLLSDLQRGWVVELAALPGQPRLTLGLWVDRWTEGPYRVCLSADGSFSARAHVAALARRLRPLYGVPIYRTDDDVVTTGKGKGQWKEGRGFTEQMLAGRQCSYAHRGGGSGYGFYAPQSPPWAGRIHENFIAKGLAFAEDVARALRPKSARDSERNGQSYLADPRLRAAIEEYAVRKAETYYRGRGFQVTRAGKPYDLRCRRGAEVRYVEVKGTSTAANEILLTPNEVAFARKNRPSMDLFVVGEIEAHPGNPPRTRGGRIVHKGAWGLDDHADRLKATGYAFKLPRRTSR